MTPEQQLEEIRKSDQALSDALLACHASLPASLHPAILQWRRNWAYHTGQGLTVGGLQAKPEPPRAAHAYERNVEGNKYAKD